MVRRFSILVLSLWVASCSVFRQPSVSSSSVDCSTSYAYAGYDLVMAVGSVAATAAAVSTFPSGGLAPGAVAAGVATAGLFLGSSAIGLYKRKNCVRWRATAPPEEWARVEAIHRQEAAEAEARAEQQRLALAQFEAWQQQQQQQPAEQPQGGEDQPQEPAPAGDDGGGASPAPTTVIVNRQVIVNQQSAGPRAVVNPDWHAVLQAPGTRASCHPFVGNPYGRAGANMSACSAWCTPRLAAKQRCQCVAGGC